MDKFHIFTEIITQYVKSSGLKRMGKDKDENKQKWWDSCYLKLINK
jgi:hypothetical protein